MELLALVLCCFVGGFGVIVLGLTLWVGMQQHRPSTVQDIAQAEATADAHFAATASALLSWHPAALGDLACRWEGSKSGLTRGQYLGRVMSLSQPQRAWLTFYLSLKRNHGLLLLRTSDREVRLEIAQANIAVKVNESPLGNLRESDGSLLDENGQRLGRYDRHQGMRWQMANRSLSPRYGAVDLRGRTIAQVNDALNWGGGLFNAGDAQRQLVRLRVENLTGEEENWLLVLVGLELYYNALRARASVNASPTFRF